LSFNCDAVTCTSAEIPVHRLQFAVTPGLVITAQALNNASARLGHNTGPSLSLVHMMMILSQHLLGRPEANHEQGPVDRWDSQTWPTGPTQNGPPVPASSKDQNEVVSESSRTLIVVTASVKEVERGGQGHTSASLLDQSVT
jgi:hypothetical protein